MPPSCIVRGGTGISGGRLAPAKDIIMSSVRNIAPERSDRKILPDLPEAACLRSEAVLTPLSSHYGEQPRPTLIELARRHGFCDSTLRVNREMALVFLLGVEFCTARSSLVRHRGERRTKIVRPQYNREDALPKSQVQKSDGKKPSPDPEDPRRTMLFDSDFLHANKYTKAPQWFLSEGVKMPWCSQAPARPARSESWKHGRKTIHPRQ
jgi:hypothetical protein